MADGPFALLMKELGIQPQGTSTLRKWTCPETCPNARFGIKRNPEIVHAPCSQKKGEKVFFNRMDGPTHTISC